MRELGRFRWDADTEEIGIYEVLEADVAEDKRKRGHSDRAAGDVELVWFDQQDPPWPVTLPRAMVVPLAKALSRVAADLAPRFPTDDAAPPIVQRVREHWDEEGYDPSAPE